MKNPDRQPVSFKGLAYDISSNLMGKGGVLGMIGERLFELLNPSLAREIQNAAKREADRWFKGEGVIFDGNMPNDDAPKYNSQGDSSNPSAK